MATRIWTGLPFVCVVAIFICLIFIKIADADSNQDHGIHAVGHASEPFCPGGYSDRGDHCQHIRHVSTLGYNDGDFDDKFEVKGKATMFLSTSESTMAAEQLAESLDNVEPQQIMDRVVVLGH